jgi:hypothetical protein
MPALLEKVMREKQGMQSDALLAGHTEWAPAKIESKAKQSARRMEELRQNSKPGTSPYHAALSVTIEPRGCRSRPAGSPAKTTCWLVLSWSAAQKDRPMVCVRATFTPWDKVRA